MSKRLETEQKFNECVMQDLCPVSKWEQNFGAPSNAALRQLIFYKDRYKFQNVVKKIGNRLYISISEFNKWVARQNQAV